MKADDWEEKESGAIYYSPGFYLKEEIRGGFETLETMSKKTGISPETLNGIMHRKIRVDKELAERLAKMNGSSAEYWENIQAEWDRGIKEG